MSFGAVSEIEPRQEAVSSRTAQTGGERSRTA